MANPQIEKGHTRIANEILEHVMKTSLNGTQFRIVIAVWRFTYGFQRKEHAMSINFIAEAIDANRRQVIRELETLIERKILLVVGAGLKKSRVIKFNKNHEEWLDKGVTKTKSPEREGKPVKKKQAKKRLYAEDSTHYKMAVHFHGKVKAVAKEAEVEHLIQKANLQTWADDFRKLVELDGVEDKKLIKKVMDWVTSHHFWRTNVLSGKKFREKFGELAIKMNEESKPNPKKQHPSFSQPDPRDKEIALQKWISEGKDPDEFDWSK
jgi:phage replication O-like protein O